MQFSVVRQDFNRKFIRSTLAINYLPLLDCQILFLNKIDLFAEKLPRSPLGDYFPDYTGGDNYDAACDYLLHRFVSLNQSAATKQIYAHYTCATDTQQIKCKWCCYLSISQILISALLQSSLAPSRISCSSYISGSAVCCSMW